MGRLAGVTYRHLVKSLRAHGFVFARSGKGSHEIWVHEQTRRRTVVPNHKGDLPEGTVRSILDLAGISVDDFLA